MWLEFLIEGLKNFAGEIIGVLLFTFVLSMFPGVRKLFTKYRELKKDDDDMDIQQVIRDIEAKRQEEANRRAELELQLEQKRHEEALRAAEAQKAEEARQRAEVQKQLEAQRQEQERIQAELRRQAQGRSIEAG